MNSSTSVLFHPIHFLIRSHNVYLQKRSFVLIFSSSKANTYLFFHTANKVLKRSYQLRITISEFYLLRIWLSQNYWACQKWELSCSQQKTAFRRDSVTNRTTDSDCVHKRNFCFQEFLHESRSREDVLYDLYKEVNK